LLFFLANLLGFIVDFLLALLQFFVFVFEVEEAATQPFNVVLTAVLSAKVFVLADIDEEVLVLLVAVVLLLAQI
jgi:hypothetical protein